MKDSTLYVIIGGVAILGVVGFVGFKQGWFKSAEAKVAAEKEAAYISKINGQLNLSWIKNLKTEDEKLNAATYAVLVKTGAQSVDQAKADSYGVPVTNNNWKLAYDYTKSIKDKLTIL